MNKRTQNRTYCKLAMDDPYIAYVWGMDADEISRCRASWKLAGRPQYYDTFRELVDATTARITRILRLADPVYDGLHVVLNDDGRNEVARFCATYSEILPFKGIFLSADSNTLSYFIEENLIDNAELYLSTEEAES